MAKPASIANLKTQGATEVDLFSGDIETARRSKVVLLNLIDDQSARAVKGVSSFNIFDEEDHGIEDTTVNGTSQNDLSGGLLPTKLEIDQFKTVPAYFKYVLGEASRMDWVASFVSGAPSVAILAVEKAAIVALRGIGNNNGHFRQLSGTNSLGVTNTVPTLADYNFALDKLCQDLKIPVTDLFSIGSQIGSVELAGIFGLYDKEASSALSDEVKTKGFIREVLGIPHYASHEMGKAEHVIASRKAVAYAIRTAAELDFQGMASQSQDYYGVRISYGVVARQDKRAVVMQAYEAWTATPDIAPEPDPDPSP